MNAAAAGSTATRATRVRARLGERWSPEQISHERHDEFDGDRAKQLVAETIYQAVHDADCLLTRGRDYTLCSRRRRRRERRRPDKRRAGGLPQPMAMIADRRASALDHAERGHWEGDFIVGLGHASAIGTLVERTNRYVILVHIGGGRHSLSLPDRLIEMFTALPPEMAKTLTWDQGKEMSAHLDFTKATGIRVYFCAKAGPWQRGSKENMNGLLRDHFPKGPTSPSTPQPICRRRRPVQHASAQDPQLEQETSSPFMPFERPHSAPEMSILPRFR